ncbi:MAG: oxygen-independent coproporphyrinogen III oxidase [Alphaproteobacteria bacterium]|jgi:oxygen-independent coproporphyrinogen-3 oxidase|nr:oxygen-independent coproporphyrinogen III oxidase [Alphaproteobacteria bacterium]
MDLPALLAKYDRPAPRYTSYPPAPFFRDAPTQEQAAARLAALPDAPVSVYVHVPFCRGLCLYCGCHTQAVRGDGPVARFVPLLIREIERVAALVPRGLPVSHIHLGGGTPNILPLPALAQVMAALQSAFTRQGDTTVAMECDPRLLDAAYIRGLARLGFTRVSLGVQDFNTQVQAATGRVQPFAMVQDQVRALRMETIEAINVDLMVGLPGQTPDSVAATAHRAADLAPSRLAVFAYAHVPWMKRHQKLLEPHGLPGREARFAMARAVEAVLAERGYTPIGIDHFAAPGDALHAAFRAGRMRRNFQGYTEDAARVLLGFGPSAISALPGAYQQNTPDMASWARAVEGGDLPVARGCVLHPEDQTRAAVIEEVMCTGAAVDAGLAHAARLEELVADGLAARVGAGVRVTQAGRPFTRLLAACFDAYYAPEVTARHAKAV